MNGLEHTFDLTSIALLTLVALGCGIFLQTVRQPAIVGYIIAGIALGPHGLRLVEDPNTINLFAEMGVLLLLFLIGMEISVRTLRPVLKTVMLCALLQVAIAVAFAVGAAELLGWPTERGVVLGFVLALSSTAIGIKILEDIGEISSEVGRITIGVLISQDLLMIPMLVVIDSMGPSHRLDPELFLKLGASILLLSALIVYLSRRSRLRLRFLQKVRHDPDLGPLAVLAFCFVVATLAGFIGLTPSYGAFVAGLVIGSSVYRKAAIQALRPIQSVLLMIFFLSIGLLVNISFIFANVVSILAFVILLVVLKTLVNTTVLNLLGLSWKNAFIAGAVMGQIGEFSFVLAAAAFGSGMITGTGYQMALSVIALSLIASPLWLSVARKLEAYGVVRAQGMKSTVEEVFSDEIVGLATKCRKVQESIKRGIKRLRP